MRIFPAMFLVIFLSLLLVTGCSERTKSRSWTEFFSSSSVKNVDGKLVINENLIAGTKWEDGLSYNSFVYPNDGVGGSEPVVHNSALGKNGDLFFSYGDFNIKTGKYRLFPDSERRCVYQNLSSSSVLTFRPEKDEYIYYPNGILSQHENLLPNIRKALNLKPNDPLGYSISNFYSTAIRFTSAQTISNQNPFPIPFQTRQLLPFPHLLLAVVTELLPLRIAL